MATNCLSVTSGYCGSLCRNSSGGVQRFYIGNVSDIDQTKTTYGADGELTELSIDSLFAYIPCVDSSSFSENCTVSPENGTTYFEQTANIVLSATSQALSNVIRDLAGASNLVLFVRDNNEKLFLLSDPTGKEITYLSGADTTSGTAYGDRNGTSLTLTHRSHKNLIEVIPSSGSDLEAALASADAVCDGAVS